MKRMIILLLLIFSMLPVATKAAEKTMTNYTWDPNINVLSSPYFLSWPTDLPDFKSTPSTSGSVKINADGTVSLGNNQTDACGVLWYQGSKFCNEGICDFNKGFNLYFEFQTSAKDSSTDSYTYADGFTFAVANGNNNATSLKNGTLRGGPPPGKSLGELLCYSGSGADGVGIQAPKLAIEFDTGPSAGGMADYGCNCAGSTHRCSDGTCRTTCSLEQGRSDYSKNNHVAVMFWGNDNSGNCSASSLPGSSSAKITYDDNIHGQGAGTESNPVNSAGGSSGYCERPKVGTYQWMEDGNVHKVRIEVKRTKASRSYEIKAWVDCQNPCCGSSTNVAGTCNPANFENVFLESYTDNSPKISRAVTLNESLNTGFNSMIFGFTVGSGWQTQTITIRNFKMYFLP